MRSTGSGIKRSRIYRVCVCCGGEGVEAQLIILVIDRQVGRLWVE